MLTEYGKRTCIYETARYIYALFASTKDIANNKETGTICARKAFESTLFCIYMYTVVWSSCIYY